MKTLPLIAALGCALTLYGCATPTTGYHGPAFFIVQLRMSKPACVYSLQAGIAGVGDSFRSTPVQACTKEEAHRAGFFASGYSGRDIPIHDDGVLELSFRRAADGSNQMVRLPMAGTVNPRKGFRVHALKAFILDEGVRIGLTYVETKPDDPARAKSDEEEIAYFPDHPEK